MSDKTTRRLPNGNVAHGCEACDGEGECTCRLPKTTDPHSPLVELLGEKGASRLIEAAHDDEWLRRLVDAISYHRATQQETIGLMLDVLIGMSKARKGQEKLLIDTISRTPRPIFIAKDGTL